MPASSGVALDWLCTCCVVLGFAGLIYRAARHWEVLHHVVVGNRKVPIRLPLVSFFWTLTTALLFFAWREVQGAVPAEANHPYFRFGWGDTLVLFGVSINTWWKYSIIQCYQVARAVLNSLVTHIYLPWLGNVLMSAVNAQSRPLSRREYWLTLAGQAATTTATWWSTGALFILQRVVRSPPPRAGQAPPQGTLAAKRPPSAACFGAPRSSSTARFSRTARASLPHPRPAACASRSKNSAR